MKKSIFSLAVASMLLAVSSCQDAPVADLANTSDAVEANASSTATTMHIDMEKSRIEWIGSKPIGSQHNGTVNMTNGGLLVEDGKLIGGFFILDMKSMTPLDQDEEGNAKLKAHLLSPDFVDAEQFPEGTFEITNIEPLGDVQHLENKDATHTITGNLTLKGISKSISFPATIQENADQVIADAHFNIIRTDWNINFNSDASIKDKFINKEINIKIHLEAHKK